MKLTQAVAAILLAPLVLTQLPAQAPAEPDWDALGATWWSHIQYLASDDLQGRLPGTPGFELATQYVVKQFTAIGLKPAGSSGYLQPFNLTSTTLDPGHSLVELHSAGKATALNLGQEITLSPHVTLIGSQADVRDAPMVFLGYGLRLPTRHMDDYAGLDLHGKIAVFYNSAPARLQGPLRAYARVAGQRWKYLKAAGAVGMITIAPPRAIAAPRVVAAPRALAVPVAVRLGTGSPQQQASPSPEQQPSAPHPPSVLYKPASAYPLDAIDAHIEGTVTVRIHVAADGQVSGLGVAQGLGHGLDESAINVAKNTRFRPANDADGNPVEWTGPININFKLPVSIGFSPAARADTAAPVRPTMAIADPALDPLAGLELNATVNEARAEELFTASGHTFAELKPLIAAGKPLPAFPLNETIHAVTAVIHNPQVPTHNIIGELEGSDSRLKNQFIVISAHLDHLGVGRPVNGDAIYNGAMDNASGIASVIETAKILIAQKAAGHGPRRSILFIALTAEEMGELGSAYFAARPTVKKSDVVADLNMDMFLPLFPLRYLEVQGLGESTLGNDARAVCQLNDIEVQFEKQPEENRFIRSDQVNFVAQGIPALAFKFGWTPDSPEMKTFNDWVKYRYHQPSDDLQQPVDKAAAAHFDAFLAQLATRVADAKDKPAWYPESSFANQ